MLTIAVLFILAFIGLLVYRVFVSSRSSTLLDLYAQMPLHELQSPRNAPPITRKEASAPFGLKFQTWFDVLIRRTFEDPAAGMEDYRFLTEKWITVLDSVKMSLEWIGKATCTSMDYPLRPGEMNVLRWRMDPNEAHYHYLYRLIRALLWMKEATHKERAAAAGRWPRRPDLLWDSSGTLESVTGGYPGASLNLDPSFFRGGEIVLESRLSPGAFDEEIRRLSKTLAGLGSETSRS